MIVLFWNHIPETVFCDAYHAKTPTMVLVQEIKINEKYYMVERCMCIGLQDITVRQTAVISI